MEDRLRDIPSVAVLPIQVHGLISLPVTMVTTGISDVLSRKPLTSPTFHSCTSRPGVSHLWELTRHSNPGSVYKELCF